MSKLEIERKFIVKPFLEWSKLKAASESLIRTDLIEQTYLLTNEVGLKKRVRKVKTLGVEYEEYIFNSKKKIENGISEESEKKLNFEEYKIYLEFSDPNKNTIIKERMLFRESNVNFLFELDVYKGRLEGLFVLEVEVPNLSISIPFPDYFQIVNEVTNDPSYDNYKLAEKN